MVPVNPLRFSHPYNPLTTSSMRDLNLASRIPVLPFPIYNSAHTKLHGIPSTPSILLNICPIIRHAQPHRHFEGSPINTLRRSVQNNGYSPCRSSVLLAVKVLPEHHTFPLSFSITWPPQSPITSFYAKNVQGHLARGKYLRSMHRV